MKHASRERRATRGKPGIAVALLAALLLGCDTGSDAGAPAVERGATDEGTPPPVPATAPLSDDARAELATARAELVASSGDASRWFAYGARLDANGLPDLARGVYERAAELDPLDPRAPYHAARMWIEHGDFERALAALDESLAREERYAPAHRRRGEILIALARPGEAADAFAQARALDPNDIGARLLGARAELEQGNAAAALEAVDGVLRIGELAFARQLRAAALRELGRHEEAARDTQRAAGRMPEWNDPWEREVKALRGGPRMLLARARALIGAGRADEALALVGDDRDTLLAAGDVGALGVAAAALCAMRRFDEARALARDAELAMPKHNRVPLLASEVFAAAGDFGAAIEAARRSIALQPEFSTAHEQLALLLETVGDRDGAARARGDAARLSGLLVFRDGSDEE